MLVVVTKDNVNKIVTNTNNGTLTQIKNLDHELSLQLVEVSSVDKNLYSKLV